jgi:hypothetical protein
MYKFMTEMMHPIKRRSLDTDDLKDMCGSLPMVNGWMNRTDPLKQVVNHLADQYGNTADVILMAAKDNNIAVQYLYEGNSIDYRTLLE